MDIETKLAAGRRHSKLYYERHKSECLKKAKEHRNDNKERICRQEKQYRSDPEVKARKIEYQKNRDRPWRKHLKDTCELCGFVPEHSCQLDVHHRDEDKTNDDPSNLMTVCANCHRLIRHQSPRQKRL